MSEPRRSNLLSGASYPDCEAIAMALKDYVAQTDRAARERGTTAPTRDILTQTLESKLGWPVMSDDVTALIKDLGGVPSIRTSSQRAVAEAIWAIKQPQKQKM